MFDFPNTPILGQTFTPAGGPTWTWNGTGWTLAGTPTAGVLNQQVFTASGTYTPTPGMQTAVIECVGGGGGGNGMGGATLYANAGGGGSGGYSRKFVTAAQVGTSQTVTVGAGGTGGTSGGTVGGTGGVTSVGSLCVANGARQPLTGNNYFGGQGALPGTGDIAAGGSPAPGGFTTITGGTSAYIGSGASSIYGGGAVAPATNSPGINATSYGAGGSGGFAASAGQAGGNGSPGIVIITEYANVAPGVTPAITPIPQTTVYTSGSGTYTVPAGTAWLLVELVGGGGPGQNGNGTAGTVGTNTTFGTSFLTAQCGPVAVQTAATATGGDINVNGGIGSASSNLADNTTFASGADGADSVYGGGGAGWYNSFGTNGNAPGAGGGGGGRNASALSTGGWGGNSGAYLRKLITNPAVSYAYTVGVGGVGAAASGNGYAGGNGAAGIVIVTAYVLTAASAATGPSTSPGGNLNKFRNGMMDVAQRGTPVTATAGASPPPYTLDGWQVAATGAAAVVSQQYNSNLASSALRIACASALTGCIVQQRIESTIAAQLLTPNKTAQPITIQFTIFNNSGVTITPALSVSYTTSRDNFTSVTPDTSPILQPIANGAIGTVAYTYVPNVSIAQGMQIGLNFQAQLAQSSGYVDISYADVRATPGAALGLTSSPPPVEMRPVQQELAFCQRYLFVAPAQWLYAAGGVSGVTGTILFGACISFPVTMRIVPAQSNISYALGGAFSVNPAASPITANSWTVTAQSASGSYANFANNAGATFSAEL